MSIMFNEICINEEMQPKYPYFKQKVHKRLISVINLKVLSTCFALMKVIKTETFNVGFTSK